MEQGLRGEEGVQIPSSPLPPYARNKMGCIFWAVYLLLRGLNAAALTFMAGRRGCIETLDVSFKRCIFIFVFLDTMSLLTEHYRIVPWVVPSILLQIGSINVSGNF